MAWILTVLATCLSGVEAGPGQLTYYPQPTPWTGTIAAMAHGGRGLVLAGRDIAPSGLPASPLVVVSGGIATPLTVPAVSLTAVDCDGGGIIAAIGLDGDGRQVLLRSPAAGSAFTGIPAPAAMTGTALDSRRLRLAPDGGLVVVGTFQTGVNRPAAIARWSPTDGWTTLDGLTGTVQDLAWDAQGRLLAGGTLSLAGSALRLARHEAGAWTAVPFGDGSTTWQDYALRFAPTPGGDPAIFFASGSQLWMPAGDSTWTPFPLGQVLSIQHAVIPVAGQPVVHAYPDGAATMRCALRWSTAAGWVRLGDLQSRWQDADDRLLVATGDWTLAAGGTWDGGSGSDPLRLWNGSAWASLGVTGLVPADPVPGWIDADGGLVAADPRRVLRHDGSAWSATRDGPWSDTTSLRTIVGLPAGPAVADSSRIAVDGAAGWQTAPFSSLTPPVLLRLADGSLLAGGSFTATVADGTASNITRWDGSAWRRLGGGVAGEVAAMLQLDDGTVVVGGRFSAVDGDLPSVNLACWKDGTWSRYPDPQPPFRSDWPLLTWGRWWEEVSALGRDADGSLVVGIRVRRLWWTYTSDAAVAGTALVYRRSGNGWTPLGRMSGPGVVASLISDGRGGLLASGSFTAADGGPVAGLARWDGNAWRPVGATSATTVRPIAAANGLVGRHWGAMARWTAPALAITSLERSGPGGGALGTTSATAPVVRGTGIPGQGFRLASGGAVVGTGTVGSDGRWSIPLTGTRTGGSHPLELLPDDPALAGQAAAFVIDTAPLTAERVDALALADGSTEIVLTMNKATLAPDTFIVRESAGGQGITVTRRDERRFVMALYRVTQTYPEGTVLDFGSALTDAAGHDPHPLIHIAWNGAVGLAPADDSAIPLRLVQLDQYYNAITNRLQMALTFSKPVTAPASFTVPDAAGNPVMVTRRTTRIFDISIPPSAYTVAGNRISFGTAFTDAQGAVIDPVLTITTTGSVSSPAVSTASDGSGGGGCGTGAALALLLGMAALLGRRR